MYSHSFFMTRRTRYWMTAAIKGFRQPHLLYKDGSLKRLVRTETIPPSLDPKLHVQSKDVVFSPQINQSCRLYLPKTTNPDQKLPILMYFHGGGFCIETAFSPTYHNYLNTLVSEANVIVVSVDYRRALEHHIPAPYDDSWAALKWVVSHFGGDGPEDWINRHADFNGSVFLAGDSAGANIAHNTAMRFGQEKLEGITDIASVLIHPYFWGNDPIGNEIGDPSQRRMVGFMWTLASPDAKHGCDDPLINPAMDPNLGRLGCSRVLVIVAAKDLLRERGWDYYERLRKSGWEGEIEIMEATEEGHISHLTKPACENASTMLKRIISFIHQGNN